MVERTLTITIEDMNVVRQLNPEFNLQLTIAATARTRAEFAAAKDA